jgi:hypothetical protein
MRPHIAAVMRDEDRNVADEPDAAIIAITPQCGPLTIELELHESVELYFICEFACRFSQRAPIAPLQLRRPARPVGDFELALQRAEQRVVVKPFAVSLCELAQRTRVVTICEHSTKKSLARSPRLLRAFANVDQPRASRERGVAAVRRVARQRARRGHRQHLPPALLRVRQEIRERVCGRAEVAARQRGRMKQQAAGAAMESQVHKKLWIEPVKHNNGHGAKTQVN